ncbi:hypothetical protein F5X68DRAFT_8012 [Plectosphaerella plurivora]|uniref:Uncharacterized protein n=1 Tax=Plectosphaerella plurivora TaxID=936078 RepID=A0A9P8VCY9_9PEZI|nr:hypothetical protein F5X68DRAFT_8012 [Plectosphaerella plurivora]
MFKFVNRSRSVKKGAPASVHVPDSPALDDRRMVSSRQSSKQDQPGFHNGGMPSPAASSLGVPGSAGGSHLHPSSPLYPPPSPASTMQDRPRTSSGPGPSKPSAAASFNDFDKRKSRDDLSLMSRSSARGGGYKSYHIPIRGKPPSPSDNGRDVSPARTIPVRTQTPESIADNNGIITIGMAIGSPTHPPPMRSYGDWPSHAGTSMAIGVASTAPDVFPPPEPAAQPVPQRSKSTRWKLFGRSKSKRSKPEPAPPPQNPLVTLPSQSSGLDRSNTERHAPKHKPIIIRSDTVPSIRTPADADMSASSSSIPSAAGYSTLKPTGTPSATLGRTQGPLLDVEIPDITMERYSVMFGGLLQSNGSSSSLLARRQATLERLRTINDRIVSEQDKRDPARPRRATSPMHSRSPSLSMFPTPPPTAPSPVPLSPRTRSATVPAGLPSNPRDGGQDRNRQTRLPVSSLARVYGASQDDLTAQAPSEAGQRRQEKNSSKESMFTPDHSSLILDSPTEEESSDYHIKEQLRPTIYEPKWEMVSPSSGSTSNQAPRNPGMGLAAQTQSSSDVATRAAPAASPAPVNTAQRHVKKTSEDAFDEAQLNAAVEISIARQISISQQQRDMLRKNIGGGGGAGVRRIKVPRNDRSAASPAGLSPNPPSSTGTSASAGSGPGSGKLAAIPSSTPTLITPPEPFVGSPLAQHRKSERIVVEGA